eukprot:TRINITY_DN2249_c0_g1_i1.p1 TRINITY_DN2249_c0_g1~~TRINITY_DN2249_c0_g1_i1.p1  ORF type:complete len:543 (+),score=61.97 TRINITY_DN2249_c0_g1_i1:63-1691(+)
MCLCDLTRSPPMVSKCLLFFLILPILECSVSADAASGMQVLLQSLLTRKKAEVLDGTGKATGRLRDEGPSQNHCLCSGPPRRGWAQQLGYHSHRLTRLRWRSMESNRNHKLHQFILYKAHRVNDSRFIIVGVTAHEDLVLHPPLDKCLWQGQDQVPVESAPSFSWIDPTVHGRERFHTVLVNCSFPQPVGADGQGGVLRVQHGGVDLVVLHERAGETQAIMQPPKYTCAYCGAPFFKLRVQRGKVDPADRAWALSMWLAYHKRLFEKQGKTFFRFHMFSNEIVAELLEALQPSMDAGLAELVFLHGHDTAPQHSFSYLTAINDCLYEMRYKAKWLWFFDSDEYILPQPSLSLSDAMARVSESPWVTLGSFLFSAAACTPPLANASNPSIKGAAMLNTSVIRIDSTVLRRIWRSKFPEKCWLSKFTRNDGCGGGIGGDGRRKYFVNPRVVDAIAFHHIVSPKAGGVHWNASVLSPWPRLHHVRMSMTGTCNDIIDPSSSDSEIIDARDAALSYVQDNTLQKQLMHILDFAQSNVMEVPHARTM